MKYSQNAIEKTIARSRKIPPKIMHMLRRVASHYDAGIAADVGTVGISQNRDSVALVHK